MAAIPPPPPTYIAVDDVINDKLKISHIWFRWFMDLWQYLNSLISSSTTTVPNIDTQFTLGTTTYTIGGNVWTLAKYPMQMFGDTEHELEILFNVTNTSGNYGLGLIRSDGGAGILCQGASNKSVAIWDMTTRLGGSDSTGGYGYAASQTISAGIHDTRLKIQVLGTNGTALVYGKLDHQGSPPFAYSTASLLSGTWYPAISTNWGGAAGTFSYGAYRYFGSKAPAPFSTVILLPLDGTNGQTTITDSTGRAWTRTGTGVAISTAQSKFGGASLLFSDTGSNSDFETPAGAMDSTDALTIEGWVYTLGAGFGNLNWHCLFSQTNNSTYGEQCVFIDNNDHPGLRLMAGNSSGPSVQSTTTMSRNAWHHIAVTFNPALSSNQWTLYLDGTNILNVTWATGWRNTGQPIMLGRSYVPAYPAYRFAMNGYIDMVRVVRGFVVYNGNFTPPTSPLPII